MFITTLAAAGTTVENAGTLSGHFKLLDWIVLVGYLAFDDRAWASVWPANRRTCGTFSAAATKLPWYAVSGSMIATIISAVTFIGVPAIV
ncbi:MAG: hypothetical protein R3C45_07595 [Phycisphaerales bacterium]